MPRSCLFAFVLALSVALVPAAGAGDAKKPLLLVDVAGKETALSNWSIKEGTRHLAWLAKEPPKKGMTAGPECLEFRALKAEMYKEDVTTFIPLSAVKQLDYDHKAKEVQVTFVTADGKDSVLRGTTKYAAINQFSFDGELGPGGLTLGGPIRIEEGAAKVQIRTVKFPEAKPGPATSGAKATVVVRGKEKAVHEVHDLTPLYRVTGGYRLVPALVFQKSLKVDTADVAKMTFLPPKMKGGGILDFDLEKRDGTHQGLTLLEKTELGEKENAILIGLVGWVPGGQRLFPATIIAEVSWTAEKK